MTREEAIKWLIRPIVTSTAIGEFKAKELKAYELAIETLSADRPTTDCTKFMEWLKAEALDEENWELNAIANGEIICRKFKKLGWLDVEDGFYVDTRPTGEWIEVDSFESEKHSVTDMRCSLCGKYASMVLPHRTRCVYDFCPNCGAKMNNNDNE